MQVVTCIITEWTTTQCSGPWPIRRGGPCWTGSASATARPSGSCASRLRWRGSQRPSIWACWRPRTSITTVRRGREKLHYLNPVPLWDIPERWIEKFERPRLRALSAIKQRAEEGTMADRPTYVYVTYIESSPERVWEALTDPDLTAQYWGHSNVSDWQAGSPWEHRRVDGSGIADVVGTVLESVPPRRLTMTFDAPGDAPPEGPSKVTFDIEPYHEIVRLTVTHENLADRRMPWRRSRPDGPPCAPTSSPCWRPATYCRVHRGRCTPSCAPPRWPATTPTRPAR